MNNSYLLLKASYTCQAHFTTCQMLCICSAHKIAGNWCHYSLVTKEESEDPRGQTICVGPHN